MIYARYLHLFKTLFSLLFYVSNTSFCRLILLGTRPDLNGAMSEV